MLSIKEIKSKSRQNITKNYWSGVVVCFILALFFGEFIYSSYAITAYRKQATEYVANLNKSAVRVYKMNNSEYLNALLMGDDLLNIYEQYGIYLDSEDAKSLETLPVGMQNELNNRINKYYSDHKFNTIIAAGVNLMSLQNTYTLQLAAGTKSLFNSRTFKWGIIVLTTALIGILFSCFVGNPIKIGKARFFTESISYKDTSATRLIFIYRQGYIFKPAIIMALRSVIIMLSLITVVLYPIVYYSLEMVPYVLAENPSIGVKDAFKLSYQLMKGNKFRAFLLDLSFIGWHALSFITLGIVGLLYTNSYTSFAEAELYLALRKKTILSKEGLYYLLCDKYLDITDLADDERSVLYLQNEAAVIQNAEEKQRQSELKAQQLIETELERQKKIKEISYDFTDITKSIKELPKSIKELPKVIKEDEESLKKANKKCSEKSEH